MSVEDEESDTILSLQDVLEEDQELENTANAVLGDSDDSQCSYSKGYVTRQALYSCISCVSRDMEPAGICLACSLHCHDGHQMEELYTKRMFRCDCGNDKFPASSCMLNPDKDAVNSLNKYNHNFRGLYCTCNRPYPDSEDEVEDEMIQCIMCEDWFHSRHLQGEVPSSYEEMACDSCMESHDFLRFYQLQTNPTKVKTEASNSDSSPLEVTQCSSENASCELIKRKAISERQSGAGYFDKNWRQQLCRCSTCEEKYAMTECLFLLEDFDSLLVYEEQAKSLPSSHENAVAALGSMNHVHQIEAIHQFNELKTELSDFLKDFALKKKVVSKRDVDDFFEEMQQRKKRRLETGHGVPPANCHF